MVRKVKKKNILTATLLWIVLGAVLTFYVIYHLVSGFSPLLSVETATVVSESHYTSFDAYVIRNDSPISSDFTGYRDYSVQDGGYVGTEQALAKVYSVEQEEVSKKLAEIDRRIDLLEEYAVRLNSSEIINVRNLIKSRYQSVTDALSAGKVADARETARELAENMYMLEELNSGTNAEEKVIAAKAKISELKAERTSLCNRLGAYDEVMSSETGYFFRSENGSCSVYSCDNIDKISLNAMRHLLNGETTQGGNVGSFMKLGVSWYIAVPTDMNVASGFREGRTYSLTMGEELSARLERIITDSADTGAVLVFSCDRIIPGFDWTAKQKVSIKTAEYSGYRVRTEAIRSKNGETGVLIVSGSRVKWREVEVLYDNGLYSIVAPQSAVAEEFDSEKINENDTYIVSRNAYEGMLIN